MKEIVLAVAKKALPYIIGVILTALSLKFDIAPSEVKKFLNDSASSIEAEK